MCQINEMWVLVISELSSIKDGIGNLKEIHLWS